MACGAPGSLEWVWAAVVVWLLPTLAISLPPVVFPHLLSFVLPCCTWVFICVAFLRASATIASACKSDVGDCELLEGVTPSLAGESATPRELNTVGNAEGQMADDDDLNHGSAPSTPQSNDSESLNVVYLNRLDEALQLAPVERVLHRLLTTNELIQRTQVKDVRSFAIISYRQVRSEHDPFTLDAEAFLAAVDAAREKANVAALWHVLRDRSSAQGTSGQGLTTVPRHAGARSTCVHRSRAGWTRGATAKKANTIMLPSVLSSLSS